MPRLLLKGSNTRFILRDRLRSHLAPRRPHALPGELLVSLTSYPPRFAQLHRTLRSLLRQRVAADRVVLWIAADDIARLPRRVLALRRRGVEIAPCEDLRSYKKLVPALHRYPDSYIVIADDDVYYPSDWLGTLTGAFDPAVPTLMATRVHRIVHGADGAILPYEAWEADVQDDAAHAPSVDIVPTGVGGVLYPPHCFDPRVLDMTLAHELAPQADDLWFFWMARLAGWRYRKAGGAFRQLPSRGTQEVALYRSNGIGGNDAQAERLTAAFGDPTALATHDVRNP